jgi:outer membrane lipoprotein carrier protein
VPGRRVQRASFHRLGALLMIRFLMVILVLTSVAEARSEPATENEEAREQAQTVTKDPESRHGGAAQTQLERFGRNLQSLQARFRQLVIGSDGEVLEQGEGQLWLRKPNLFRWRLEGEFPELIVADGERVWIFYEALEQVTVRRQAGLAMDSPLLLLGDPSNLERQFRLAELGEVDGRALLELTPRAAEAEFERVILGLLGDLPVTMLLEDSFGLRTEIRFEDLQRDPPLAPDLFQFDPPAGVDLVGDLDGLSLANE